MSFNSSIYEEVQRLEQDLLQLKTTQNYAISQVRNYTTETIHIRNRHKHIPPRDGFPARDIYFLYCVVEFEGDKPDTVAVPIFNFNVTDLSGNILTNIENVQFVSIYSNMQYATTSNNKFRCFVSVGVNRFDGSSVQFNVHAWANANCKGVLRVVQNLDDPTV